MRIGVFVLHKWSELRPIRVTKGLKDKDYKVIIFNNG